MGVIVLPQEDYGEYTGTCLEKRRYQRVWRMVLKPHVLIRLLTYSTIGPESGGEIWFYLFCLI